MTIVPLSIFAAAVQATQLATTGTCCIKFVHSNENTDVRFKSVDLTYHLTDVACKGAATEIYGFQDLRCTFPMLRNYVEKEVADTVPLSVVEEALARRLHHYSFNRYIAFKSLAGDRSQDLIPEAAQLAHDLWVERRHAKARA